MVRGDQRQPPRTPKKKGKASGQAGTPSAAVPMETGPAPPNSLEACIAAGDIYTVKLGGANGGVVGVGETGGLSDAKIQEEAVRVRDTPAPTSAEPCVTPTWEQLPRVVDPNWLGDGPGPEHYKYESDTSKELREQAWTVGVLLIYLRMQFWLVLKRGFRPMCCLCIGVLFLISMKPLVYRPLFEKLADEGVKRMQDHKLQPSTLIGVLATGVNNPIWCGKTEEGADSSSLNSNGVARKICSYVGRLRSLHLLFMAYADVTVYFRRDGNAVNKKGYDIMLESVGADAKFVASSVHPSQVAIALLELGAAGNKGRISILMPVWCSELDCWLRGRFVISRDLVDTPVQPSDELCAGVLAAAEKMAHGSGGVRKRWSESGLVYNKDRQNGPNAIILGDYNGRDAKSAKKLRKHLRAGLKYGPEMAEAAEKMLGEVAGDVSLKDVHEAAKAAGFPSVEPNSAFAKPFRVAFDHFLGAVGKKLHKVGCMGSINTKKGKRAAEDDGSGSLGQGGKGSKKPRAKKKKKSPYPRGPGQPGQAENALFG